MAFALLARYYKFSHIDICNLTLSQFNKYLDNISSVESILTGEKIEFKEYERKEVIKLMKDMDFKVPE